MTTPKKSVDIICQCRKGSMDDKQFRATVQHNIDLLIQTERQKREEVVEKLGKELFQKTLADMKMSDDLRVAFLKAFIQLNYPHYRDWFTQPNNAE